MNHDAEFPRKVDLLVDPHHDDLPACTEDSCECCSAPSAPTDRERAADPGWLRAARLARRLAWASLIWMSAEGVLGLIAGITAGPIALVGWALGSVIEGLASVIVVWRFTGARTLSRTSERRAQKAVAISFWLLAPYIVVQATRDLISGHHADATVLGTVLTALSVVVMPVLGMAKHRLGARLDSQSTAGEGLRI